MCTVLYAVSVAARRKACRIHIVIHGTSVTGMARSGMRGAGLRFIGDQAESNERGTAEKEDLVEAARQKQTEEILKLVHKEQKRVQ